MKRTLIASGNRNTSEREPERVLADVRSGLVSRATAERDYGVVLDDDLIIDADATARLRGTAAD